MTRIIAHRALTSGIDSYHFSNSKPQIERAVSHGFDIEIDVRFEMGEFFLGHDHIEYDVSIDFLNKCAEKVKVYLHCKTLRTLEEALIQELHPNIIPFFHDVDDCILLKDNTIWIHPKAVIHKNFVSRALHRNSILVLPTLRDFSMLSPQFVTSFKAVCTDYPIELQGHFKEFFKE